MLPDNGRTATGQRSDKLRTPSKTRRFNEILRRSLRDGVSLQKEWDQSGETHFRWLSHTPSLLQSINDDVLLNGPVPGTFGAEIPVPRKCAFTLHRRSLD
jgi:hypothetical protein